MRKALLDDTTSSKEIQEVDKQLKHLKGLRLQDPEMVIHYKTILKDLIHSQSALR